VNWCHPGYAAGSYQGERHAAWRLASSGGYRHRPSASRDYAQAAEGLGYRYLVAPDHVLGVNPAADHAGRRVGTTANPYHDPFVLFGFLAGCTQRIGFAVGCTDPGAAQAVLVAKQAASLDVLSGGRFRLGIGVGWNEVEFVGLNENFHNRGKRSEEQVRVMQALWANEHVDFTGEFHRIEDAGINPRPTSGRVVPIWLWRTCRGDVPTRSEIRRRVHAAGLSGGRCGAGGVRQAAPADARGRPAIPQRWGSRCGPRLPVTRMTGGASSHSGSRRA